MTPYSKETIIVDMVADFREVFGTEAGGRVLLHLAEKMYFFADDIETPEQIALSNMFKKILVMAGIFVKPNGGNIIRQLLKMPVPAIEPKKEEPAPLTKLMEDKYGD
jgi:hypothetical protein